MIILIIFEVMRRLTTPSRLFTQYAERLRHSRFTQTRLDVRRCLRVRQQNDGYRKPPSVDGYDPQQADYSASATAATPGHIDANSASVTTAVTSKCIPYPLIHGPR